MSTIPNDMRGQEEVSDDESEELEEQSEEVAVRTRMLPLGRLMIISPGSEGVMIVVSQYGGAVSLWASA